MANYKVTASQIRPNQIIYVRGRLTFSRIASKIEGEELAKMNERKKAQGRKDITEKPHTTATICNAQVVPANPAGLTPEEIFIAERMGMSTKNPENGNYCTSINKGNSLPKVMQLVSEGKYKEVRVERELANGLDVTLVIRTFKGNPNNGTALDGIFVNEEIRYFDHLGLGLEQRGYEVEFLPNDSLQTSAPAPTPTAVSAAAPIPVTPTPYSATPNQPFNPAAAPYTPNAGYVPPTPSHTPFNPAAMPVPPTQNGAPGIVYGGEDRKY